MVGERLDAPQEDEEAEERAAAAVAAAGQTDQRGQRGEGNLDSALCRPVLAAHAVFPPPIATKSLCPLPAGKSSIQTVYYCVCLADTSRLYLTLYLS